MVRPRKWRRVCCLPESTSFGPLDPPGKPACPITMSVDEFETIRLIDLEGLTQEECAGQMGIARTTIQRAYNEARRKLADSLVNGKALHIEGGDFQLCSEEERPCGRRGCHRGHEGKGCADGQV